MYLAKICIFKKARTYKTRLTEIIPDADISDYKRMTMPLALKYNEGIPALFPKSQSVGLQNYTMTN